MPGDDTLLPLSQCRTLMGPDVSEDELGRIRRSAIAIAHILVGGYEDLLNGGVIATDLDLFALTDEEKHLAPDLALAMTAVDMPEDDAE